MEIISILFNPDSLRAYLEQIPLMYAYILIFLIVFAESGFLFGFFLPGDSLVFIVGLLASISTDARPDGILNIFVLVIIMVIGAILGDNLGYYTGARYGKKLYHINDTWYFKKKYLHIAEKYYKKRGGVAVILARFLPTVRTFAPIIAGIVGMNYKTFLKYNIIGGLSWITLLLFSGFFLGKVLESSGVNIESIILPITVIILVLSFSMAYYESRHTKELEEEVLQS